ncbi:MAG: DUF1800 domain-containing protein [Fimbriimonadaceae bacterium]
MQARAEESDLRHLLRRFGLGASVEEVRYYRELGYERTVDALLGADPGSNWLGVTIEQLAIGNPPQVPMQVLQSYWAANLLCSRSPLIDKMSLFWHDHFAVSAAKVTQVGFMYDYVQDLRQGALGNFKSLTETVCKSPAMLFWLDTHESVKGRPNENFARELMELFTLGIGEYTEKDVQEASRAFTGWGIRRMPPGLPRPRGTFLFTRRLHDSDPKTIRGRTGAFTGEQVIEMMCEDPATHRFIVKKLWEWFVYPDPEPDLVERFAREWRSQNLEMKPLLRSIMLSPEFRSDQAKRKVFKNPIDFCVPVLRQLGVGERLAAQVRNLENFTENPRRGATMLPANLLRQSTKNMGMELLWPPDVAGWEKGASWISSATMLERAKFSDRVWGAPVGTPRTPGNRPLELRLAPRDVLGAVSSGEELADTLIEVFDAPVSPAQREQLIAAANSEMGSGSGPGPTLRAAHSVSRLIFVAPEFQMN